MLRGVSGRAWTGWGTEVLVSLFFVFAPPSGPSLCQWRAMANWEASDKTISKVSFHMDEAWIHHKFGVVTSSCDFHFKELWPCLFSWRGRRLYQLHVAPCGLFLVNVVHNYSKSFLKYYISVLAKFFYHHPFHQLMTFKPMLDPVECSMNQFYNHQQKDHRQLQSLVSNQDDWNAWNWAFLVLLIYTPED